MTSLAVSWVRNLLECRCCPGNEHTFRNSGPFIYGASEPNCCIPDFVSITTTEPPVKHSSPIVKRIHLRFSYCLGLLFFVFCEMFLPIKGWTQSFAPEVFYFTGSQRPLRGAIFREPLPGEGLKVGRVQVHPFLGTAEVFTDNVFRTKTNREHDFLTAIAPGIQANLPFGGRHSFLLDYRAAQLLYARFTENNVFAQHGVGHMKLDFQGGLKFDFQGGRTDGFDPRGSEVDIQEMDITKWRINNFLSQAQLSGQRGRIRLRSFYADLHYKNNGQATTRDRKRIGGNLTVFFNATPTFSPLLGVRIINNDYDTNKQLDSFSYGGFAGFRLAPSRLLSGEFRIGYTILNFDRAPEAQPPGSDLSSGGKQQTAFTMVGNLNWRPTSRFSLQVRPFRLIRQSATFDTTTFVQTGVGIQARHQFTDRLDVRGRVNYANANFEGSRTDNRIRTRIGLGYRTVKWLGFRLEYIFGKRFSNESRFENYSNSIMVSVQALL